MRKRMICFLMTALLSLAAIGCSSEGQPDGEENTYQMYYLNEKGTQVVGEEYEPAAGNTVDMIQEFILNQSAEVEDKDEQHILPEGVSIEDFDWKDGILTLDLSSSYLEMENTREIVARVGLVRTFTQIPGVMRLKLLAGGEPLRDSQDNEIPSMDVNSFVENSGKEINTYQNITMTLYFANADGTKLVPEQRSVYYSSNVPLERVVVEQLIKGPKEEGRYPTLPTETHILSVTISDEICYVNFDDSFMSSTLSVSEELPVYSIVNSLAKVCRVREVQFSINGESKVTFRENMRLDQLFQWEEDYIQKDS